MKKLWKNNRVMFLLITILLVCFVSIVCVALTFFYSRNVSKYGNRLDKIDKYPIKSKVKETYRNTLVENEGIDKVTFKLKGRIIYISVNYSDKIELDKVKEVLNSSLEVFDKKTLGYYDIQFILRSGDFSIIGSKNAVTDHISWNNNRVIEKADEKANEEA